MKNDSSFNYVMAGFYRTAVVVSALIFSVSAFAADPPVSRGNVSVNVNPTTGYYSVSNTTLRLPDGVRATPSAGATTVTKYAGGLKQSIPTGITIDAIKKTAPLPVFVRATTPSLKTAAKGLFKGGLLGIVLSSGLQQLLDGIDALIDEGGNVVRTPTQALPEHYGSPLSGYYKNSSSNDKFNSAAAACAASPACGSRGACFPMSGSSSGYCSKDGTFEGAHDIWRRSDSFSCSIGFKATAFGCLSSGAFEPVPLSTIDNAIDSSYTPEPSDWKNLTPYLAPDDIEITWAPTLEGDPVTTTVYDAEGNPVKVRKTNIWYDFDIRDNPSPQPKLDVKKREETKTFEDGVLTGTTTTESTKPAGSGGTSPPPPESPIDCDLFPTACAWFDWTKEEPAEPDDDLSKLLKEVPIVNETYTITGGAAACPAPLVLDLSVFGSREVSYQPLCDLASTMKYLYLALMSFAAAVLLNRSINRV